MGLSHSDVRRREVGIRIDGLLKVLGGCSLLFITRASPLQVYVVIALEVGVQNLRFDWLRLSRWVRSQLSADLARDFFSDLPFERENIPHISFVSIGPEMLVRCSLDELCGDAHAIAGSLHCTFYNAVHTQLTRNFGK